MWLHQQNANFESNTCTNSNRYYRFRAVNNPEHANSDYKPGDYGTAPSNQYHDHVAKSRVGR
jgi:hypothetical protein